MKFNVVAAEFLFLLLMVVVSSYGLMAFVAPIVQQEGAELAQRLQSLPIN